MSRTRVLIVDDSSVIRRILSDILTADPRVEVVGVAAHAEAALQKLIEVNPDVVTLDVEMPGMSGIDAISEIRRLAPNTRIIMFSALTERAAAAALDAMARGAADCVAKPHELGSREEAIAYIRDQLIARVVALGPRPTTSMPVAPRMPSRALSWSLAPQVVAIGASTGGPNALAELLGAMPPDFRLPVLIVQHMPPLFTRHLAERLDSLCPFVVREATHGVRLAPGHVYIAPGDFHMRVNGRPKALSLDQGPPENSVRPAVDCLFSSVAEAFGASAIGVVLTGMGQDGLRGAEAIKSVGGRIIVQDEASSVVWGMPGLIAKAGLADKTQPVQRIAQELAAAAGTGRSSCP